jgi:hypothetical protein
MWGCDIMGPIKSSIKEGNILVFVVYFTKWVIAVPLQEVSAATVSKAIYEHIYVNFGPPKEILTDNASYFVAEGLRACIDVLETKYLLPAGYHPQCNGLCVKIYVTLLKKLPFEVLFGCQPWTDEPLTDLGRFELQRAHNHEIVCDKVQLKMEEVREGMVMLLPEAANFNVYKTDDFVLI